MMEVTKYLSVAALAALALATTGCIHSDGDSDHLEIGGEPGHDVAVPPDNGIAGPVAFMAGVDRFFMANRTVRLRDDGMTMVVEDTTQTPSGWKLIVDGRTVEFDANDYGAESSFPYAYYKQYGENEDAILFPIVAQFVEEASKPEYDHLNVYGFYHGTLLPGVDSSTFEITDYERGNYVYIVHGTPSSDMPVSGTATYEGDVHAREWPSDAAVFSSDSTVYSGDFEMTADFATSGASVTGKFSFPDVPDGTISFAADITGNQLSASGIDITEGGFAGWENIGVRGAFFGPDGAEVGGVFDGENAEDSTLIHGWFAGNQQ